MAIDRVHGFQLIRKVEDTICRLRRTNPKFFKWDDAKKVQTDQLKDSLLCEHSYFDEPLALLRAARKPVKHDAHTSRPSRPSRKWEDLHSRVALTHQLNMDFEGERRGTKIEAALSGSMLTAAAAFGRAIITNKAAKYDLSKLGEFLDYWFRIARQEWHSYTLSADDHEAGSAVHEILKKSRYQILEIAHTLQDLVKQELKKLAPKTKKS